MDEILKDNALAIFREQMEDRGFFDWIKKHLTYEKPAHRYEGNLTLYPNKLIYAGTDIENEEKVFLEIAREDLTDLNIGFDDTYQAREDRYMGDGFQPVRLTYLDNGLEKTIYFIMDFDRVERKNYKNQDWYEQLSKWKAA